MPIYLGHTIASCLQIQGEPRASAATLEFVLKAQGLEKRSQDKDEAIEAIKRVNPLHVRYDSIASFSRLIMGLI